MDDLNRLPGDAPVAWKKPRGRPFAPGVSGNPKGRPKGARNKATIVVEVLREGEAEALTLKLVEKALAGDSAALRMCVKRLWAPKRGRRVEFDLPELNAGGAATASQATSWQVADFLADGRLRIVLEAYQRPPTPLTISALRNRLRLPKVRAFVDFLQRRWMHPPSTDYSAHQPFNALVLIRLGCL